MLTGTIAADGSLVLKLFFDLNKVPYTIHHYLRGTTNKVAEDETGTKTIGETLTAGKSSELFAAYENAEADSDSLEQTITIALTGNVITVYYAMPVTVTANDKTKTYGEADPQLTATVEGLLGTDTVAYTLGRAAGEDVGTYAITPAGEKEQGYYNVTYVPGTLTITKATAADIAAVSYSDEYDAAAHGITVTGTITGDKVYYSVDEENWTETNPMRTDVQEAETVYVKVENPNYNTRTAEATITITPATITVIADAKTKVYGEADPALTYTNGKGVNDNEVPAFTGALARAEGENVGSYAINQGTVALADNGAFKASNYVINYTGANLVITQKPLTITADSDSKVYDGTALMKNSYTSTALATGDSIESVTVTGSQTVVGSSDNVPSAAVIKNAAGDDVTTSYNITYAKGTLEVTQKTLTITADSDSKVYDGSALTKNSYTNTALATGDSIASVTVTGSQTVEARWKPLSIAPRKFSLWLRR